MAKILKLTNKIATTVISIIFLFVILISIIPKFLNLSGYYVETDSMEPEIYKGSIVFVEEVEFSEIKVGDIMTFESKDKLLRFTHRVYKINYDEQLIYTKGDKNEVRDPNPVLFKRARGRVVFTLPLAGYLIKALNSTGGHITVAIFVIIWLAVEIEIWKLRRKELSKADEKKNN